jgi:hypothetical protein
MRSLIVVLDIWAELPLEKPYATEILSLVQFFDFNQTFPARVHRFVSIRCRDCRGT